jgi:RNA-binding protein
MSEATETERPLLSSVQKKILRSMGHHLEPTVYVGKDGLSPALIKSAEAALKAHELIKIKLGQNCPLERNEAAEELARTTESSLVQVIGRMVLLHRANPDLPAGKRIIV